MNDIKIKRNNILLLTFLIISLFVMMFVRQDEVVERLSFKYFLIMLPALLFPLTRMQAITYNLLFKTWPLLLMLLITMLWGLYKDDLQSVFRLSLFLLILSWLEANSLILKVKTLSRTYIFFVIVAIFVNVFSDLNPWGILPMTTDPQYGIWRVSFFPNIANTAFLSLFIFMVCTRDKETLLNNKFVAVLSLYFIIFSFVRSAVISLMVYLILQFIFNYVKNIKTLFILSLLATLALNIIVGYASVIIELIQSQPLVNRFLLRGEHALSHHDIYVQMYRPWVWKHQWNIFINSPYLMGERMYNFNDFIGSSLRGKDFEETDSVSLLLGLLASYGLPALLFYYYLLKKNFLNAMQLDRWACAIFPIIIFICMQWGSIFHPACATFIIFFMILLKGKKAFI